LTPPEAKNVRAALRFLRVKFAGGTPLAAALRVNEPVLRMACSIRQPSAAMAIRAARIAGMPVEDLLSGRGRRREHVRTVRDPKVPITSDYQPDHWLWLFASIRLRWSQQAPDRIRFTVEGKL